MIWSRDMSQCILVVDDDHDIRDSLVELLTERGFPAVGAGNGVEALEVLRTSESPPSLILLDLMMPVMDGREFRERQLENPAWRAIPVIVISAYSDVEQQARALALDHLRKPLAIRPLIDAIRRHVAEC
jgi:CheY-like chemotaxis protein